MPIIACRIIAVTRTYGSRRHITIIVMRLIRRSAGLLLMHFILSADAARAAASSPHLAYAARNDDRALDIFTYRRSHHFLLTNARLYQHAPDISSLSAAAAVLRHFVTVLVLLMISVDETGNSDALTCRQVATDDGMPLPPACRAYFHTTIILRQPRARARR